MTFTDIEALSLQAWICMQHWATGDVVKLFIEIKGLMQCFLEGLLTKQQVWDPSLNCDDS